MYWLAPLFLGILSETPRYNITTRQLSSYDIKPTLHSNLAQKTSALYGYY